MTEELIRRLSRPGTVQLLLKESAERAQLHQILLGLRTSGHAVVADETFDHDGQPLSFRVFHYLNCKTCKEEPRGKI